MPLNKSRSGLTAQNEESILRQGAFTVIKIKRGGKLFSRGQVSQQPYVTTYFMVTVIQD